MPKTNEELKLKIQEALRKLTLIRFSSRNGSKKAKKVILKLFDFLPEEVDTITFRGSEIKKESNLNEIIWDINDIQEYCNSLQAATII